MIRFFIVFILFFVTGLIKAQESSESYSDGYVLTIYGDTLYGKLKILNKAKSCRVAEFMNTEGKLVSYSPSELKAYVRGEELYEVKYFEGDPLIYSGKNFMKKLADGRIKLYEFHYTVVSIIAISSVPIPTSIKTENLYIIEKNNVGREKIGRWNFKNPMTKLMSDYPEFVQKIKTREWVFDDMFFVVKLYNSKF